MKPSIRVHTRGTKSHASSGSSGSLQFAPLLLVGVQSHLDIIRSTVEQQTLAEEGEEKPGVVGVLPVEVRKWWRWVVLMGYVGATHQSDEFFLIEPGDLFLGRIG